MADRTTHSAHVKSAAGIAERVEALAQLREIFPIGSTVATIVTHVSNSGMARDIVVLAVGEDGVPYDISWQVARATGSKLTIRRGGYGVRLNGAGMDMAYHLVYGLGVALHGYKPNGTDYALNHRSI